MTNSHLPVFDEFPPTEVLNKLAFRPDELSSDEEAIVGWLYGEMRRLAQRYASGDESGATGRVTELVGATYAKLFEEPERPWFDREQFFERAGRCMRQLVAKRAKDRLRFPERRGEIAEDAAVVLEREQELVDLERALVDLEVVEPRYARIIELRYFAGLSVPAVARALNVSVSTVERDWRFARAWIMRHMRRS